MNFVNFLKLKIWKLQRTASLKKLSNSEEAALINALRIIREAIFSGKLKELNEALSQAFSNLPTHKNVPTTKTNKRNPKHPGSYITPGKFRRI